MVKFTLLPPPLTYFYIRERFQGEVEPHVLKRVPRHLEVHLLEVIAARKAPFTVFHVDNDALLLWDEVVEVYGPRQVREDDAVAKFPHAECEIAVVEDGIYGGRGEVVVRVGNEVEIVVERLRLVDGVLACMGR